MKNLMFFALAFSMHLAAQAADGFSTLEERMSGKEFKETGLVKLNDEELSALNDWIRRHSVATLENATARQPVLQVESGSVPLTTNDTRGLGYLGVPLNRDPEDKVIYGNILGTFVGSGGKGTKFVLTNGMIWEQTAKDAFSVNPVENAEVTITKNLLGNWHLSMVGDERNVRVKRIR